MRIAIGAGLRTVVITELAHRSAPFHSGASLQRSPVSTASIATMWTPGASWLVKDGMLYCATPFVSVTVPPGSTVVVPLKVSANVTVPAPTGSSPFP